jgi:hypothetical protein
VIDRWAEKQKISERRSVLLEKKILLAAYIIRKLTEANKVSTSLTHRQIVCQQFPAASNFITIINKHRIDKLYSLTKPRRRSIGTADLINLIIHSFIFEEVLDSAHATEGFYVTSDRRRYSDLWHVSIARFTRLMREYADDRPSVSMAVFDPDKNDYFVWQGMNRPPKHVEQAMERIRKGHR